MLRIVPALWVVLSFLLAAYTAHAQAPLPFQSGQAAEFMLSGHGFDESGGPLAFNHPTGIASDGTRLLVCDRWNNRVLVWNTLPERNEEPDLVLGQPNFYTNRAGEGRAEMNWPGSVEITADGRVIVADSYNHRLLVWNSVPTVSGQPADLVITHVNLEWPWGVWSDGTRLAASSTPRGRVLVWNTFPTNAATEPDLVLDGGGQLGTPRTFTSDGTFLMVGDHNPAPGVVAGGQGSFVWTSFPTSDHEAPDFFLTDASDPNFAWLQGDITDDGRLVALGRTLRVWNTLPEAAETPPDVVVDGFAFEGGDGADLVVAGGRVYMSLMNANMIVVYNEIPTRADQPPDFAIGAADPFTDGRGQFHLITNPVPASDGQRLVVSSDFDRAVHVWHTIPNASGAPPDVSVRLPAPPWDNVLYGDTLVLAGKRSVMIYPQLPTRPDPPPIVYRDRIGSAVFHELSGVALDDRYFYLADRRGTIWVWEGLPENQDQDPAFSFSIERGERLYSDGNFLSVPQLQPPIVRFYEVDALSAEAAPKLTLSDPEEPHYLDVPHAIAKDGLFIAANVAFNTVLVWTSEESLGDRDEAIILGGTELTDRTPRNHADRLFWPGALAYDGTYIWAGEYKFSGRVLAFRQAGRSGVGTERAAAAAPSQMVVYPNPTLRAATARFELAEASTVQLDVYDLLGRQVVRGAHGWYGAGTHAVEVDFSMLMPGAYTLLLRHNERSEARLVIVGQ